MKVMIIKWLIKILLPGYHLSKSPPKGRKKKEVGGENEL